MLSQMSATSVQSVAGVGGGGGGGGLTLVLPLIRPNLVGEKGL